MFVPLTPLEFPRRSRQLFGAKAGVVDGGRRISFSELAERAERLAGALRAFGLRPREIVSVLSPNTHALLEAFYGVPLAGGVIHPVNPRLPALDISGRLNDAGARILIFHAAQATLVREILGNLKAVEQLVIVEGDPRALDFPTLEYEALLRGATPYAPDLSGLDENAACALFHTSGAASKPRGVLLSHRSLALHALYAAIAIGLREEDVSLCSVPFAYMNGGGSPQTNLAVAATSVLARTADAETLLGLVERERVSVWITAPTVLQRVLGSASLGRFDTASLRLVLVGGAPVPEAAIAEAEERLGARTLQVYGLTETSPFVTAAVAKSGTAEAERRSRQATTGLPILGVETRVVDENGREVPRDDAAVGEILVRGNNVMTAYHRDAEATQEALRGGFLHTGDLATVAPDGYLTIRGRKKDVIFVRGRRVTAREVEAALASHPDVREVGVIPGEDAAHAEAPVALVVLGAAARVTESELIAYAKARLDSYKVPVRIEFLAELPRNEAGELLKSELRTLYG